MEWLIGFWDKMELPEIPFAKAEYIETVSDQWYVTKKQSLWQVHDWSF